MLPIFLIKSNLRSIINDHVIVSILIKDKRKRATLITRLSDSGHTGGNCLDVIVATNFLIYSKLIVRLIAEYIDYILTTFSRWMLGDRLHSPNAALYDHAFHLCHLQTQIPEVHCLIS